MMYLPKKALKTKSNFFLRNSDNGIFEPCEVKWRERSVRCVRSVNIRSRSSDDQGRLSRATDPSFFPRVKSNRCSLVCISGHFVCRPDIREVIMKMNTKTIQCDLQFLKILNMYLVRWKFDR